MALVAAVGADSGLNAAELIAEAARTVGGGGGKGADLAAAGGNRPSGSTRPSTRLAPPLASPADVDRPHRTAGPVRALGSTSAASASGWPCPTPTPRSPCPTTSSCAPATGTGTTVASPTSSPRPAPRWSSSASRCRSTGRGPDNPPVPDRRPVGSAPPSARSRETHLR